MQCLRCGKESKWEYCRECKAVKHRACTMISQNKTKLVKLLDGEWLTPEGFGKFIMYTNNILKYGKVYMEYKEQKRDRIFRGIANTVFVLSGCIALWSVASLVIIRL